MKFLNIEIKNFLSFKEENFPIGDYSGCTLIEGCNKDNPGALSNGGGKTSAFEALVWCLFGKTCKGITGDNVVNDSVNKDCYVKTTLTDDVERNHTITRYRKHPTFGNRLELISDNKEISGGMKEVQEKVNELLGLDYNTFISSIYIPQEFTALPDKTNTERIELISRIMKLDIYDKAKDFTKERVRTFNDKNNSLETELERYKGALEEIISIDYKKESIEFEHKKNELISTLVISRDNNYSQIKKIKKEIYNKKMRIEEEIGGINFELNQISLDDLAKVDEIDNQINKLKTERDEINRDVIILKTKQGIESDFLRKIDGLKDVCPTCIQKIPAKYKSDLCNKQEERIGNLNLSIAEHSTKIDLLNIEIRKLEEKKLKLENLSNQYSRYKQDKEQLKLRLKEVGNIPELYELDAKVKNTINRIKEEELRENPYTEKIKQQQEKIKTTEKLITSVNNKIKQNNKNIRLLNQLIEIFGNKGIKCTLLDSVIDVFEKRTNYYLDRLSANSIGVGYNTSKSLMSGEMVSAFDIVIKEDGIKKVYEKYSGGEKQRIRIAITLALSDLVLSRFDKIYDLVIFDECDQNLDDLGIENMFEAFNNLNKTVFLITQKTDLKDKFEQVILVKKENGESKLIL